MFSLTSLRWSHFAHPCRHFITRAWIKLNKRLDSKQEIIVYEQMFAFDLLFWFDICWLLFQYMESICKPRLISFYSEFLANVLFSCPKCWKTLVLVLKQVKKGIEKTIFGGFRVYFIIQSHFAAALFCCCIFKARRNCALYCCKCDFTHSFLLEHNISPYVMISAFNFLPPYVFVCILYISFTFFCVLNVG